MRQIPVLIVGGGPIGLSMAILLERFGIDCMVVERSPTVTNHPKARGLNPRTMEIFRVWGIDEPIRAGGLGREADVVHWCESLSGPILGSTHPEGAVSGPSPKSMVAQNVIEDCLVAALSDTRHVEMHRLTEMLSLEQDETGATARLRDLATGEEADIRAQYVIACDGASSGIRRNLGIAMDGPPELARYANHYFSADLSEFPHLRGALAVLVVPPEPDAPIMQLLGANPDCNRFLYMQKLDGEADQPISEEALRTLFRAQWGLPDLAIERISVLVWRMSAQVASRFRDGRVFLAGDAAHRFPPTGGMGLNSGVQDVHNLAWKLAFVLKGQAEPAILDTYETERRPIAVSNTNWSAGNFDRLSRTARALRNRNADPAGWRAALIDMDNHLHSDGQSLGYIYEDGAIVDDGSPMPPVDHRYYWPTDRPGARFPHMWLDAGWTRSTLDWFDTRFVLVCGPKATGWELAGQELAGRDELPLAVKTLKIMTGPLSISPDGAVLVRPDGHVAWRAAGPSANAAAELGQVLRWLRAGGSAAGVPKSLPATATHAA